jgi:hypothetical protein
MQQRGAQPAPGDHRLVPDAGRTWLTSKPLTLHTSVPSANSSVTCRPSRRAMVLSVPGEGRTTPGRGAAASSPRPV